MPVGFPPIAIGSVLSGGTQGSVLFVGAGGLLAQDNANFFWDDTNDALTIGSGSSTVTSNSPVFDGSQTWNNGAVAFTGIQINITNTASAASSLLQDWQVGGSSLVNLSKAGVLTLPLEIDFSGTTATFKVNGSSVLDYGATDAGYWTATKIMARDSGGFYIFDSGSPNAFLALKAVFDNVTNHNNWFIGNSGLSTVTGTGNCAMGDQALGSITSGGSNMAIGALAATLVTTGGHNVAIGFSCLTSLLDGSSNIAIGENALASTVHDFQNIAIGRQALQNANFGGAGDTTDNIAVGFQALQNLTTAEQTIGIGTGAGSGYTGSGTKNLFLGFHSGNSITNGSNITIIGNYIPTAGVYNDIIALAHGSTLGADYNITNASLWTFAAGVIAPDLYSNDASFLIRTKATLANGAAANTATLTNAPAAGNPTKWISIDDNGTTRKIPAW